MKKLYIIDAYSFIYRFYYAYKNANLTNKQGLPTSAIFGFARFLLKFLAEDKPEYVAMAFDVSKPTFRFELYEKYKQNRIKMPDDLQIQIPYIKKLCDILNIKRIEMEGYEADDIIATLSAKLSSEAEISILTGDKDLLQLVSDKVKVYQRHKKGEILGPADVETTFGVKPDYVIDKLALMGDTSDNVPGVRGIGPKTATKLITQFGHIENLYEHLDEISAPKLRDLLISGKELAFLSKQLVILNKDLPLTFTLDDFKTVLFDTEKAKEFFDRLEFHSLLRDFGFGDKTVLNPSFKISNTLPSAFTKNDIFLYYWKEGNYLHIALKQQDKIEVFLNKDHTFIEDFLLRAPGRIIVYRFKDLLKNLGPAKNFEKADVFDTMLAYWLLGEARRDYTFSLVIRNELGHRIEYEQNSLLPEDNISAYIAKCVEALSLFYKKIKNEFEELDLDRVYYKIEKPLIYTLSYMERTGIKIDKAELERQSTKLQAIIKSLSEEITELAGEPFNINSTKQLQVILYEKLGIKHGRKIKTGYSTDEKTLNKIRKEHPIVEKILEYREYTKLLNTYIAPLPTYIAEDGRIHTTFNQTGTITGRLSSENPNMQNIPIRDKVGRDIRKIFVAETGYSLVSMDYSQIELRLLAHFSQDEALLSSFHANEDIHRSTAARIFNVRPDEVTDEMRRFAKIINFSIIYGKTQYGLAQDLKISVKEAGLYISNYFETHPGVADFLDKVVSRAKEDGFVKTMYGRIRYIPEMKSSNLNEFGLGKRYAVNTVIQGTAADIIKIAMNNVLHSAPIQQKKAAMLLQIHDELLFEIKDEELDNAAPAFQEMMENVDNFLVPLNINMAIGKTWYAAK